MASDKVIGIDLGTTNSCVAIVEDGTPSVIPNRGGYKTDSRRLLTWNAIPTNDPNIEVLAKVMSHTTVPEYVARIGTRLSGTTSTANGYFACLDSESGAVDLLRYVNGTFTRMNSAPFSWSTGSWYWIRYRANGTSHKIRAWADGATEPGTWNIDTVDSSTITGGWTGVGPADHTDSPYYDYFAVGINGQTAPSP